MLRAFVKEKMVYQFSVVLFWLWLCF